MLNIDRLEKQLAGMALVKGFFLRRTRVLKKRCHLRLNILLSYSKFPKWSWMRGNISRMYSRAMNGIQHIANLRGYDLPTTIEEKLEYNRHRADHKRENREQPGGKSF